MKYRKPSNPVCACQFRQFFFQNPVGILKKTGVKADNSGYYLRDLCFVIRPHSRHIQKPELKLNFNFVA